ncbi:MAG: tetratricopeptide repeat protein [Gammaproteobacteria bacterium]
MMGRFVALLLCVLLASCSVLGPPTLDQAVATKALDAENLAQLKKYFAEGERLYAEGSIDEAEKQFSAMLILKPEDDSALYRLGTIAFRRGEYAASADFFERTVKSNPRNQKAHYNLASLRLMQAENHFKYYAALSGKDTDLAKVTELLGSIDRFAKADQPDEPTHSLDRIAGSLKK